VKVGTGQPASVRQANYTRMLQALTAASATSPLQLPAGTIELDIPSTFKAGLRVKAGRTVAIQGAGNGVSRLKFGPESPTYEYKGFTFDPKTFITIKDVELAGPSNPGPNGQYNKITNCILQSGQSGTTYNHPYKLRLERARITGEWYTAIQGTGGDGPLELIDCDITGYTQCVGWSATYNSGKSLVAVNTYFHDAGLPGKGHLVYPSPAVSLDFKNCRFGGNLRRAVHHYGSGQIAPRSVMFENCTFEATCKDGIETAQTGTAEIIGCTFLNKGIGVALKGHAKITNSTFTGATINTYDIHSNVNVEITSCRFTNSGVLNGVWKNCTWTITDCEFNSGQTAIGSNPEGTKTIVDRCRFNGTFRRGVMMLNGQVEVKDSTFTADFVEGAVIVEAPTTSQARLTVTNTTFTGAGRKVWVKRGPANCCTY
jgi:hypothetical protein